VTLRLQFEKYLPKLDIQIALCNEKDRWKARLAPVGIVREADIFRIARIFGT
jgi:hypothetical protein